MTTEHTSEGRQNMMLLSGQPKCVLYRLDYGSMDMGSDTSKITDKGFTL